MSAAGSPPSQCDPFDLLLRENESLALELKLKKDIIAELKQQLAKVKEDTDGSFARDESVVAQGDVAEAPSLSLEQAQARIRMLNKRLRTKILENAALTAKVELMESLMEKGASQAAEERAELTKNLTVARLEKAEAEVQTLKGQQAVKAQDETNLLLRAKVEELKARLEDILPRVRTNEGRQFSNMPYPGVHPSVCVSKNLWVKH